VDQSDNNISIYFREYSYIQNMTSGRILAMSPKQKIALCAFLISLGFAMMCGVTLMATQVALGTFLFAFALMLAPLAAIFMLLVSWYMNVGTISRALFGLSGTLVMASMAFARSEEHTSELQSRFDLVCRLLL